MKNLEAKYKPVPKGFTFYYRDFLHSTKVLRDLLKEYNRGKSHMIIPISGQIRSLIAEKSNKNPSMLQKLSKDLGINPKIFCHAKSITHFKEFTKLSTSLMKTDLMCSEFRHSKHQQEISIDEFLEAEAFIHGDNTWSVKELVTDIANNAGGSHYSDKAKPHILQLLYSGNLPMHIMSEIAQAVLYYSKQIVVAFCDFDLSHTFYKLKSFDDKNTIFHFYHPIGYEIRFLKRKDNIFDLVLRDAFGLMFRCSIYLELIDEAIESIGIRRRTTKDLKTEIIVYYNGSEVSHELINDIFYLPNRPIEYQRYYNRGSDKEQETELNLVEHIGFDRVLNPEEEAILYAYYNEKYSSDKVMYTHFPAGTYGFCDLGCKDMDIKGTGTGSFKQIELTDSTK